MKKLHIFILKSFIKPLAATFFISLFVLLLQILWRYIDILVGKGLDAVVLSELLLYAVLQVIPMAVPLAVLLASLMAFGNMGENYELTAIKASGISLFKTMRPLIILTAFISILTLIFSDNVMPWANLKFYSRMYAIKTHHPDQEIREGVFNKMDAYSIKVNAKDNETGTLYGVMIYDHSNVKNPNSNVTFAEKGSIKMDERSQTMQLTLLNGTKYEENVRAQNQELTKKDIQQYRRDKFKKQVTHFTMENNQLSLSDETGYTNHNKMKNLQQLNNDIHTFQKEQAQLRQGIKKRNVVSNQIITNNAFAKDEVESIIKTASSRKQQIAISEAKRTIQNKRMQLNQDVLQIQRSQTKILKHQIELHRKFTLAFTCFIFFFIGSSLGAIIRKGGLGMPVVLAIGFFIIYYLLDTFGANVAIKGNAPVALCMWLSPAILLVIGMFLTYQSATDSSLLSLDDVKAYFRKRFKKESFDLQNSLDK